VDLDGRKAVQPFEDRNVVVGSCLIRVTGSGNTVKKRKADRALDVRSQAPKPSWNETTVAEFGLAVADFGWRHGSRSGSRGGGHRMQTGGRAERIWSVLQS